ncbi:putative arginine ABC transporter, periplasmic arginine-binding protein ArtJ [Fusobacterium equinum]|uniref:Putative arginine ABC transporter, periplasmic arginine-binding protein ArtJ n=1 Tax=Fusobacterium equinum TaxID=134605 RepID=A0A133NIT5_9FUSO|nr:basic amino acid ABC transporter substrate-binding protein [Fusobacterium equinum]KXA16161.1 putative arginine ABC transporter, periplasmic arginine-binding protein ArtJ [Fusobacterium equinum]
MKIMKYVGIGMGMMLLSMVAFGKTLYVGTNAEFAPFEYLEKGKVTGFDMELMNALAKEMKMDVKIENMAFDGLLPALQMKKVDVVIAGMTETPERKKAVSFTKPYFKAKQVIITKKGKDIKDFKELSGKKVGVMLGFTGDAVVSDIKGVKVQRFDATYSAVMALEKGKVDAVVADSEPAKKYIASYKDLAIASAKAEEEDYAIAVRKNDKALLDNLNKALVKVKSNGTYDALLKKYFK